MKSKLFILSVVIELTIITLLVVVIRNKKGDVAGNAIYNPINKDSIAPNPQSSLKYYYEPKKNTIDVQNPWIPYKATDTINSDTLNERFDYSVDKKPGTFRIVTIGDSWTYGLYVDTKDNWTEKLEDMLNSNFNCNGVNKVEVINLGVPGYDIQYEIERFKLRGEKYNPDLVLWLLKADDLMQINEKIVPLEERISAEMHSSGEFEKEVAKGVNYPSWDKAFEEFYKSYGSQKIVATLKDQINEFPTEYQNPLVILTMPIDKQYGLQKSGEDFIKDFMAGRQNVKLFEGLPDLFSIPGSQFPTDTHPNKKGHEEIAKSVYNYITSNNLMNCYLPIKEWK